MRGCLLLGYIDGPLIPALKYRVMRQERAIRQAQICGFQCHTQDDAEAFLTLVQRTERFRFPRLFIQGAIGEGGWTALAKALRLLPPPPPIPGPEWIGFYAFMVAERNFLLEGRRVDLRAIWDALPAGSYLYTVRTTADGPRTLRFFHAGSPEDWKMLRLYLYDVDAFEAQI